jgi:hypothetical protein
MFGKFFGKKKIEKPKKVDVVITVDYITATGQKKYDEFDAFSTRMGELGLNVDTSEYEGGEGGISYTYRDDENHIEIDVDVGVNVKHNREYHSTIDYFDYSVEAIFDEDQYAVDGGKKPEKVLAEVERLMKKASAIKSEK